MGQVNGVPWFSVLCFCENGWRRTRSRIWLTHWKEETNKQNKIKGRFSFLWHMYVQVKDKNVSEFLLSAPWVFVGPFSLFFFMAWDVRVSSAYMYFDYSPSWCNQRHITHVKIKKFTKNFSCGVTPTTKREINISILANAVIDFSTFTGGSQNDFVKVIFKLKKFQ